MFNIVPVLYDTVEVRAGPAESPEIAGFGPDEHNGCSSKLNDLAAIQGKV